MSRETTGLDAPLADYIRQISLREPDVLRRLRDETASHPRASMQTSPECGQFLAFLIETMGASSTVEVGVFTGYSALAVALALPEHGRVVACELNAEYTETAIRYWKLGGVDHKIDLRFGPAAATLDQLLATGSANSFDFAFIDADKPSYYTYYEKLLQLVRPGGVIAIDNVLWGGAVLEDSSQDESTRAIQDFNRKLSGDRRISLTMIAIGDGLTLARKR